MNAAYFHIALVHIPVILCPVGVILLAIAHYRHSLHVARVGLGIIFAASIVVVPVFLLGEPAEEIVEHIAGISEHTIEEHEEMAEIALWLTLAAGCFAALAWLCISKSSRLERPALILTFIVSTLSSLTLGFTAHRGGAIRHPEAFSTTQSHTTSDHDH